MGFWEVMDEALDDVGVFKYIIYAIVAVVVIEVIMSLIQLAEALV